MKKIPRISKEDKFLIYDEIVLRDEGCCIICGGPGQELAHIIPRSHSRKDAKKLWAMENLCLACCDCHQETREMRIKMMQTLAARFGYTYDDPIFSEYAAFLSEGGD